MNVESPSGSAAGAVVGIIVFLIGLGLLVWYLWAMARLFPRIGLQSRDGWIPVWNQWKLLERGRLPGWVVLLVFVGLGIVPYVMLIVAMHRVNREYRAGTGYTVLGALLGPLWATLLATHIDEEGIAAPVAHPGSAGRAGYASHPGSAADTAPVATRFAAPVTPPPPLAHESSAGLPAVPPVQAPSAQTPAAQTPQAQTPAAPPAPPSLPAPAVSPAPPSHPFERWAVAPKTDPQDVLGGELEAEYQRLAAESFQAPPATPLGAQQTRKPFSWEEAAQASSPNVEPHEAPYAAPNAAAAEPALAVFRATGITGKVTALPRDDEPRNGEPRNGEPRGGAPVGGGGGDGDGGGDAVGGAGNSDGVYPGVGVMRRGGQLDRTVIVPRSPALDWVLELADGTVYRLDRDVVIGRRPTPTTESIALPIPDPSRTLSKNHVRMVFDGSSWQIEDLGSTNGLVLIHDDGSERELAPGQRVLATERMRFGTLEVTLRRGGGAG